jgi:hypothetical protein
LTLVRDLFLQSASSVIDRVLDSLAIAAATEWETTDLRSPKAAPLHVD